MWANYGQVRLHHIGRPVRGPAMGPARPSCGPPLLPPAGGLTRVGDKIRFLFSSIEIGNCAPAGCRGFGAGMKMEPLLVGTWVSGQL